MSTIRYCDLCGQVCIERMNLTGWWGKHIEYKSDNPNHERWGVRLKSEIEEIAADVCRQCTQERLMNFISFYPTDEYRQQQKYEERRQKYPDEALLKSLRMTIPGGLEDVCCDICGTSCFNKHLRLRPLWSERSNSAVPLEAVLCEQCVAIHLQPLIKCQAAAAGLIHP